MQYPSLSALMSDRARALTKGPIALVLLEDNVEVESTITHLRQRGFAQIIAFGDPAIAVPEGVTWVTYDIFADAALPALINRIIPAAPGQWLHYCYNAEYLFYPFCEDRTVGEVTGFAAEERRDTILTYVIDLYAEDLGTAPSGVDRQAAYLDKSGYYALAQKDAMGATLDRQMEFYGGLRWRFEEHVPKARRRIDRMSLFRAVPGLEMARDHSFNLTEHNTVASPWHNSVTAAVCSFRMAKALKRNPGSRYEIDNFRWQHSVQFNWQSQQLCDLGLMEPGQWF